MPFHSAAQTIPELLPSPVVMYSARPSKELVLEMHEPEMDMSAPCPDEVNEPGTVEIVIDDLPGVEALDPAMEQSLEVNDNDTIESARTQLVDDTSKKSKKDGKWDWDAAVKSNGTDGFVLWIKERLDAVPKHSGYDTSGVERAVSYLDRLDNEISKAMRTDLDGHLDADKIEKIRAELDDGIERLHARVEKINKSKKHKKKSSIEPDLVKEAQKAPSVQGIVITVPLLISRCARVCINGTISAGHDIEEIYKDQVEKYDLSLREQAELQQHLADLGYPFMQDRGYLPNEDVDRTKGKYDWMSQYQS
jgi:hypothetical protein